MWNVEEGGEPEGEGDVAGSCSREVNLQELDPAKLGQADKAHSVMARGGAWKRPRELQVDSAAMDYAD